MRGNMKAERVRRGMSAAEVANEIGVHVNALLRWENGQAEPLGENIVKLSKLYEVSPEYLLEQTSNPNGKVVARIK